MHTSQVTNKSTKKTINCYKESQTQMNSQLVS